MTGTEFSSIMKACGLTQQTLGERWGGMARQTIGIQCNSEEVEQIFADAIKSVAVEFGVTLVSVEKNGVPIIGLVTFPG